MNIQKYSYLWEEEKNNWALVNTDYGYAIVNIKTQSMLIVSDDALEKELISKMEEAGNSKYESILDVLDNKEGTRMSQCFPLAKQE